MPWTFLTQNPVILWGGLILAFVIYIAILEARRVRQDDELKPPEPKSLREIVRPKVQEFIDARGQTPKADSYFKIGRDMKGQIDKFVETRQPKELLDPNPKKDKKEPDDYDENDMVEVRIISIEPASTIGKIALIIKGIFGEKVEDEQNIYVFRTDAFLDTPGDDMVVDPDVMSYNYSGMEIQIDDSTRNVVNQAVQTDISEKLLAGYPYYTEKVDHLFPLHSMERRKIKDQGEHLQDSDF